MYRDRGMTCTLEVRLPLMSIEEGEEEPGPSRVMKHAPG